MVEAEVTIDAEVAGRLPQVGQNVRTVRDGLGRLPRAERIAQREHVGVGADPRIAKQIPGAADVAAPFEDRITLAGAMGLQVVTGSNAGNARTDDQNVEVLDRHVVHSLGKDRCLPLRIGEARSPASVRRLATLRNEDPRDSVYCPAKTGTWRPWSRKKWAASRYCRQTEGFPTSRFRGRLACRTEFRAAFACRGGTGGCRSRWPCPCGRSRRPSP